MAKQAIKIRGIFTRESFRTMPSKQATDEMIAIISFFEGQAYLDGTNKFYAS